MSAKQNANIQFHREGHSFLYFIPHNNPHLLLSEKSDSNFKSNLFLSRHPWVREPHVCKME